MTAFQLYIVILVLPHVCHYSYILYTLYCHLLCHGDALCSVCFCMFVLWALLLYTLCCVLLYSCLVIRTPSFYRCATALCVTSTVASSIVCCLLLGNFLSFCIAALYCLQFTATCFVLCRLRLCHSCCCCILQPVAVLHYMLCICCHMVTAYGHHLLTWDIV